MIKNMNNEYAKLKKFEKIKLYYDSALKELETKLNIINEEYDALSNNNPINHIKIRMKSISSIVDKLERKHLDINIDNTFKLTDIVGARIVCNFIDDVYDVVNRLKEDNQINIIEEIDYIKKPKNSGYRGYHIIVLVPITINGLEKNIKAEIQVRTNAMDFWASSEHKLNYKKTGLSTIEKKELRRIANDAWKSDVAMNKMNKKHCVKDDISLEKINKVINTNMIKEVINWRKMNEVYE